mmetsp:Transcript_31381/g.27725  ORF Transcript_31381/g.27725 Transcript_31381/m.27725 type:complete len:189 (+) Transcript_31381:422-988(+)
MNYLKKKSRKSTRNSSERSDKNQIKILFSNLKNHVKKTFIIEDNYNTKEVMKILSQIEWPHKGYLNLFKNLKTKNKMDEKIDKTSRKHKELEINQKNEFLNNSYEKEDVGIKGMSRGRSFGDIVLSLANCQISERKFIQDDAMFRDGSFEIVKKNTKIRSKPYFGNSQIAQDSTSCEDSENVEMEVEE